MSCLENSPILGCHTDKDGNRHTVVLHYTYSTEGQTRPNFRVTDLNGDIFAGANLSNTVGGACESESACWKDKFIEGGLDNTFTSFKHTNQVYAVTFSNNDVDAFGVPSATSWSDQVQQMADGLSSIMPWAVDVDSYCNIQPNGCGGLQAPVVELNQMIARYVGFRVCPADKVPVSITYTSDQVAEPKQLIVQYVETSTIYLDRCFSCGSDETFYLLGTDEEYEPICAVPCSHVYPDIPLSECSPTYKTGCDDLGTADQADNIAITAVYQDCGAGLVRSFLIEDEDGGFVEYPLVGQFVDCDTGEIIPDPLPDCQDFEIEKLFTLSSKPNGLLNNREWHDTAPVVAISASDTATGAAFRENHDFSLAPDTVSTVSNLGINDTNNTAGELDVQVYDGHILVSNPIYIRYTTASEGYQAIELGECGTELELKTEAGGVAHTTPSVLLPVGVHDIRIWNIDSGGTSSAGTLQYSYDNINWISDSTPPDVEISSEPITETCALVKICKPSGEMFDYYTDEKVDKADYYPCSKLCVLPEKSLLSDAVSDCSSGLEGNYDGAMPITTGRPSNAVPWELVDNRDPSNQIVIASGNTFQEFSASLAAAGYSEFIEGEIHYICPCPEGLDVGPATGAYFVTADGSTVVKGSCVDASTLPNSPCKKPESSKALLSKICNVDDLAAAIASASENTHLIEGCIKGDDGAVEAFTIVDDEGNPKFAPIPLSDLGFIDCCEDE